MKVSVERAVSLAQGCNVVADNTLLQAKVSYWLGRLGAKCISISKQADKDREKFRVNCFDRQEDLKALRLTKATEAEKEVVDKDITAIDKEFQNKIDEILMQEEEIGDFKKFKVSDFTAKEEIKHLKAINTEKGREMKEFVIKANQALVPVEFFKLMDDFIEMDA